MIVTANTTNIRLIRLPPWNSYVGPDLSPEIVYTTEGIQEPVINAETSDANIMIKKIPNISFSLCLNLVLSVLITLLLFSLALYSWLQAKTLHPLFWLTGAFGALGVVLSTVIQLVTNINQLQKGVEVNAFSVGENPKEVANT